MKENKEIGNKLSIKDTIQNIVDNNDTRAGRIFDRIILFFIFFSLSIYAIGTLTHIPLKWRAIIKDIDTICYIVFTIEYLLRFYLAKKRFKFIVSFYGIIDLLAILPFLLGSGFDLRALRVMRIFRIIRALKISRYNESLVRFTIAIKIIRPELTLFFIVSFIFIFISAGGIYFFEHEAQPKDFQSIFHSLWWAVITFTTVGYGDVYPLTVGGKTFTFFMLLIGLGIVTIPAGLIASALSQAREINCAVENDIKNEIKEEIKEEMGNDIKYEMKENIKEDAKKN